MSFRQKIAAGTLVAAMLAPALGAAQSDPLGNGGTDASTIVIGSADFPESQLIATIYSQALATKGITVASKMNIGSREVYIPALLDGSIDLIPEYAGALLRYVAKDSTESAPDAVATALKAALPAGVVFLTPSPAQDTTTLAVTKETAEKYGLKAIGDLAPHAKDMVLGGPPEWKARPEGVLGFERVYGVTFGSYKALDVCGPLTLSALVNGQITASCLNSTDPAFQTYGLIALEDPQSLIPSQNIIPVMSEAKASPEVAAILDSISAALTTQDLVAMNSRIVEHDSYEQIATDWLASKGLN